MAAPDDNSFFSGHAASTFSCITFINTRFHLKYAEPVLWAVAGGLVGYGAGKVVAHRSLARLEKRAAVKAGAVPDSSETERSWIDGVYVSRRGSAWVGDGSGVEHALVMHTRR